MLLFDAGVCRNAAWMIEQAPLLHASFMNIVQLYINLDEETPGVFPNSGGAKVCQLLIVVKISE